MSPDVLLLGLRFLRYALAMLLWGSGLYVTLVVPVGAALRLQARLAAVPLLVAFALVVVTALRLPLMAASFGSGWPDALRPEVVAAVLGTWAGMGWMVDAVLCLLLVGGAWIGGARWRVTIPLAGLFLLASLLTGHAAMGAGIAGLFHQSADGAHLLAAGFWLGALPALALTLRQEGASRDALQAVDRFGIAGQAAVAVVLGTGIANAILIKGGAPFRWSSTYDTLLLLKVGVVVGMICLACYNHFRLLPRIAAGSGGAAAAMRRLALLEVVLGFIAVALVSIFGTLDAA